MLVENETCKKCKENLENLIHGVGDKVDEVARITEKRMDSHAIDIKEVSKRTDKLTDLMEVLVPRVNAAEDLAAETHRQIELKEAAEEAEKKVRVEYAARESKTAERHWGTKEKVMMAVISATLGGGVTLIIKLFT